MHLAHAGIGDILLIDKVPGLARGKVFDLEDCASVLKCDYNIQGAEDIGEIKDSDIVVITAGLSRGPGMTREDLLNKNAQVLKDICIDIKKLAPEAIVITVTNPLDLMTYLALKITGFKPAKVFGMGVSLDEARFANLIGKELNVPNADIETRVIASHGEGMLPLPRFTAVKGVALDKFLDKEKIQDLIKRTFGRGAQIVAALGSGSAYFAPAAAGAAIVKAIIKDEKRIFGVCAYLNGEYGIKDACIGVPCRLGKEGIEKIIELDLNKEERESLFNTACELKKQYTNIITR